MELKGVGKLDQPFKRRERRIHSMELKENKTIMMIEEIATKLNPFNGIERCLLQGGVQSVGQAVNPFNGIERCPGSARGSSGCVDVEESIQWN